MPKPGNHEAGSDRPTGHVFQVGGLCEGFGRGAENSPTNEGPQLLDPAV